MPIGPDNTLPWWMEKTEAPWQALLQGVQAGSAIRSNQLRTQQLSIEAAQNMRREETATQIRMLDLGLEKQRNDIALKTFQAKNKADMLRIEGMSKVGDYLGEATRNGKLTDPETQAGFWRLTSQYAPFIPEQAVNSMWDNTFKSAMERDDRAKGLTGGKDQTSAIQNFNQVKSLQKAIDEAPDDASKAKAQKELDEFRHMAGVFAPDNKVEFKTVDLPDGTKQTYYTGRKGEPIFVKTYDERNIKDNLKLSRFQSAIRSYDRLWEDYDPLILTADGQSRDPQKLIALKEKAYQEAIPGGASPSSKAETPASGPAKLRYDPATDKLVPK